MAFAEAQPLHPTVTVQVGSSLDQLYAVQTAHRELSHVAFGEWPAAPELSATDIGGPLLASATGPGESRAVWEGEDAIALLSAGGGILRVTVSGVSPLAAALALQCIRERLPAYESADLGVVPVTFWVATPHGGHSIRRDIDAGAWDSIAVNYPRADGLGKLMSPAFRPGVGGQLLLWHGEPGTGKTTALRALAREWREWADLHYIVDPDTFFGSRADYMMSVMTQHDHEGTVFPSEEARKAPRWRVLVLEDCGELLQPDAKREVGQALARLLNACDGLIGRGLRILLLLTTNEPVEKLHEAVARPGRCAARVEFGRFSPGDAQEWLARRGADCGVRVPATLADLYGAVAGFGERPRDRAVGFAA